MSLKRTIAEDVKTAMKAGERERVSCLRMLQARILEREVELRAERGRGVELDDDEARAVIGSYAKQRRESIESYRAGGREELAAKEEAELAIVTAYLPRQLGETELREIVRAAIAESGATSARDLGNVMKAVMPRVQGLADGKLVNRLVRELLAP